MSDLLLYDVVKGVIKSVVKVAYRIEAVGVENFPEQGPVIVAANHQSFLDSIFIPVNLKRRMVYLAKAEYFDDWRYRWLYSRLGMIPLPRQSRGRAEAALQTAVGVLAEGGVLGVYPEGTRSPDGRVYRGRTGIGRLAHRSGAPVVPVGVSGSMKIMPKGARFPRPIGKVTVTYGEPMTFEKYLGEPETPAVVRAITDEIMGRIVNLAGAGYVDEYASIGKGDSPSKEYSVPRDEMLG
ncbi:MAG: lysophospholipid acyltransferase family protein [Actinomycetota bacterium]